MRLPLSQVEVVLADDSEIEWLKTHDELVREELNVKAVEYTTDGDQYVHYTVVPNFKRLGPKVGKQMPAVKKALQEAGASLQDVIRTRVFVTDISHWEAIGRAHGEAFAEIMPASAMVEVSGLIDPDMLVEIEADAIVSD